MPTLNQLNAVLEDVSSLKMVAQAYTEISAIKLQKIRSGIERNRIFFQEITSVFRMVKVAADQRGREQAVPAARKKKAVSILLTSNQRFYGDLEYHLTQFFTEHTSTFNTDRIVIGSTAKDFFRAMAQPPPHQLYLFSSDIPPLEELRKLVDTLTDYEQIFVYYCRMQSVLVQTPSVVDLLQKPPEHYLMSKEHSFHSIFEPDIDEMLQFFNTQITMLLLEQIFLESELARTAARLTAMNQAELNADDMIKKQRRLLASAKRSLDSARLLDTIAGMSNWRKEHYGY